MSEIVVIGYGNPLRSDDGIGWHVIRELEENPSGGNICYQALHQLNPELADLLHTASYVIFIDGAVGEPPGEIRRTDLHPGRTTTPFHHHRTPESLLSLTLSTYGRVAHGILFTVTGLLFDFGESLSPLLQQLLPDIVEEIRSTIQDCELKLRRVPE